MQPPSESCCGRACRAGRLPPQRAPASAPSELAPTENAAAASLWGRSAGLHAVPSSCQTSAQVRLGSLIPSHPLQKYSALEPTPGSVTWPPGEPGGGTRAHGMSGPRAQPVTGPPGFSGWGGGGAEWNSSSSPIFPVTHNVFISTVGWLHSETSRVPQLQDPM